MDIVKSFFLTTIFGLAVYIGNFQANYYINRVKELISIKSALNILENKIKFTQLPLRDIFKTIEENCAEKNIKNIFHTLSEENSMNTNIHKEWESIISSKESNLNDEDKKILADMGKILGSTDIDGQVSNIKITSSFIDKQIENAEREKESNVKMCRTLGIVIGLIVAIILI